MTPDRSARGARASVFAAVCVALAATSHILMSGRSVASWTLPAAFVVTMAVAWALAGRERDLLAVTAAAVTVQGAMHTAFSWCAPTGMPLPAQPPVRISHGAHEAMAHATMGHSAMASSSMDHVASALDAAPAAHAATGMSPSFGMLAAHLLSAVLSGLWLAYGERAVFRVLRALPATFFRPLRLLLAALPAPQDRTRPPTPRRRNERAPRQLRLAHFIVSRGPPQALAVV